MKRVIKSDRALNPHQRLLYIKGDLDNHIEIMESIIAEEPDNQKLIARVQAAINSFSDELDEIFDELRK